MFNLLITDGQIIDGTGSIGYYGSVAVEDDRLTILRGDVSHIQADRTISAHGRVVCPGFIDLHAHSGLIMLEEPLHEPKVRQGITTELIGVDGNSYAPFYSQSSFDQFLELNSGLDGAPILHKRWSSVSEYLDMFDGHVAVNVAYIIGNAPLRIEAVGWANREATGLELENMKAMLREAMEEGAFGISTGLDYPPGSYADTDELASLSEEAGRLGGIYHTHVRNTLGDRFLDPIKEAIEIGRRGDIPAHVTHLYQRSPIRGSADQILELLEKSQSEGLDVTFDSYPYEYGSTRLLILIPQWAHDGGVGELKKVLRSSDGREKLKKEMVPRGRGWDQTWLTYFKRSENKIFEGRSIAAIAEELGKDEVDTICDLLLAEDLQTSAVMAGSNVATLHKFISHPLSMVGTDALLIGDYPSPRTYGSYPQILSRFVREERYLSIEQAVRKMTSFASQRLGLKDRGMLRDGMHADIVVFDPCTIGSPATRENPKQFPIGIDLVIVNGKIVVENGNHTGALPGRALRRNR